VIHPLKHPIILHLDNQSTITLTHSQGQFHAKHIGIRWHFICYSIKNGCIELAYCPTENMSADILTKPPLSAKVKHFAHAIELLSVWGSVGLQTILCHEFRSCDSCDLLALLDGKCLCICIVLCLLICIICSYVCICISDCLLLMLLLYYLNILVYKYYFLWLSSIFTPLTILPCL
jgi:hypothetical protein